MIAANLDALFPGRRIREHHLFRVTRDADMEIREDEASDLLETMEEMMRRRPFGEVVRLSLNTTVRPEVRTLLVRHLNVNDSNLYEQDGPLGLSALLELLSLDRPDLKDPPFVPAMPPALHGGGDVFARAAAAGGAAAPSVRIVRAADRSARRRRRTIRRCWRSSRRCIGWGATRRSCRRCWTRARKASRWRCWWS